jgi:hypothetical protein
MWTCPECSRSFRRNKQQHICVQKDPYDLVEGKPDNVLLAFDTLLTRLLEWEGCGVDASKNTVLFNVNLRVWLVVRPMKDKLDLGFYYDEELQSPLLHRIDSLGKQRFMHHVRIEDEVELTAELMDFLKIGFDFAANKE